MSAPLVDVRESDLRDHWDCQCGAGVCVPSGDMPTSLNHVLYDGRICGRYELSETCIDCWAEDE